MLSFEIYYYLFTYHLFAFLQIPQIDLNNIICYHACKLVPLSFNYLFELF